MIGGFMLLIAKVVWDCPQNLDLLKTLSAIFLGPIGTILGFYFGQRPVEKLTERTEDLIKQVEQRKNELEEEKDRLKREKDESAAKVKVYAERMEKADKLMERLEALSK